MTAIDISRMTFGNLFRAQCGLIDALVAQAFPALQASAGAEAYHDRQRNRGAKPQRRVAPARQPAPRHPALMLKTRTPYDEATAWSHDSNQAAA